MAEEQKEPVSRLSVRLDDELIELGGYKTGRIIDIIEAPSHQTIQRSVSAQNEDGIHNHPKCTFDVNYTFAHSLFGASVSNTCFQCRKACQKAYFYLFLLYIGLISFTKTILFFSPHEMSYAGLVVSHCMFIIVCLPTIISLVIEHSFLNKEAFAICIKSFDYCIKMIYFFIFAGCFFFLEHKINSEYYSEYYTGREYNTLNILYIANLCFQLSVALLSVSFISLFDASRVDSWIKYSITIGFAILCFVGYFLYQFVFKYDYEIIMDLPYGKRTISIKSLILSSLRILGIFIWKQMYKLCKALSRSGNKKTATTITITPTIEWVGDEQEIQQNQFAAINTADDDVAGDDPEIERALSDQLELATHPHMRRKPASAENMSMSDLDTLKEKTVSD